MYYFEIVGHRGAPGQAPENTLLSFERAMQIGVDWIEFDVRRSRDGVLVVIHDETVDRTTDGSGRVRDMGFS
ncbi:glycerophosphodiester phosphodiesterase [Methanocella conradii]|uniref:glycerophosphodiester phosphodiesterase n=1 Tax=Methanocella conradii TaxID=1175444 RepID=UPI0020C5ECC2|nr:glycerophosphodiester phosphodiesterase family protein [Methanocella conradii]